MYFLVYPHCAYSNVQFSNARKQVAKCRFEMCSVNTKCAPGNELSRALSTKYSMRNAQGSVCAEDNVLREHRIVKNCELEENAGACIYDLTEIILELYDSGIKRNAKKLLL